MMRGREDSSRSSSGDGRSAAEGEDGDDDDDDDDRERQFATILDIAPGGGGRRHWLESNCIFI